MITYIQTPSGSALPIIWKEFTAAAANPDADMEEDDGNDDYERHMRFECRQERFV